MGIETSFIRITYHFLLGSGAYPTDTPSQEVTEETQGVSPVQGGDCLPRLDVTLDNVFINDALRNNLEKPSKKKTLRQTTKKA